MKKVTGYLAKRWDVLVVMTLISVLTGYAYDYFNLDRYYSISDIFVMGLFFLLCSLAVIRVIGRILISTRRNDE